LDGRLLTPEPDSTLPIIEGSAHMPNLERPAKFNAALAQFLSAL
jgi:pimeloyl-ACP methyl ester carboxylesterase